MTPGESSGPRILVCEDEDGVREFIQRGLELSGYQVTAVPDARSAEAAMADNAFDLLITDVSLPDADGIDLARRLGRDRPTLRVAVITGYIEEGQRVEELDQPVKKLITKPFTLADLRGLVAETLAL